MSKFPIPSIGKQPTSRCRSAGNVSIQPKIGYHFNMSRPGTPLTPSEWDNAQSTPSPGEYGDPLGMSHPSILPRGGAFANQELPSVFDMYVASKRFVPGPGTYEDIPGAIHTGGGIKFSDANVPSDVDKLVKVASKAPSSFDYRPEDCKIVFPRDDIACPKFTVSLRPSFIDEAQRAKKYIPGPSTYQSKTRVTRKNPRSSFEDVKKIKSRRGGNNEGPKRAVRRRGRPSTSSSSLSSSSSINQMLNWTIRREEKKEEKKMNDIQMERHSKEESIQRPMTSPQKHRKQQRELWQKHRQQFSSTSDNNKRPTTTIPSRSRSAATFSTRKSHNNTSNIIDAVTNRSRQQLSKKLTSPLWKYEIPQGTRGTKNMQSAHRKTNKINQKQQKQQKQQKHHQDTTLVDMWQPTAERPFLSLKETMELATISVRSIDAATRSQQRNEAFGKL